MKTKSFFKIVALVAIISFASCSKDSSSDSGITASDAKVSNKLDQASNDISAVVEDQFQQQNPSAAGKNAVAPVSILPSCATVTTTTSTATNTWTRTVVFTNCTFNGNTLDGTIVVSGSLDFSTSPYVINYHFVNFHHNDFLIEGDRTVSRSFTSSNLLSTNHPIHVMDINMTATSTTTGDVYTRVGTRKRECIAGFDTPLNWHDNIYLVTGTVTTTKPNGTVHTNTVTETNPLRVDMGCDYRIVSGILTITKPNHTAVIDYGDGTCDNNATVAIDGGTPVAFTFGN